MKNSGKALLTGVRDSKLSLAQSRQNIARLKKLIPGLTFDPIPMSSPGDRDQLTDLRVSDPDFFTRDLDDAVLNKDIDCALHSAKDLPPVLRQGLDLLYLPWFEDQRDVLVYPVARTVGDAPRIGVSSERREIYSLKKFPNGQLLNIRGNIEDRIEQLDNGKYDVLIMAAAGLIRLGLQNRISEYISLEELPPPPAQGWIAMTFRKGDAIFNQLRKLFVHRTVLAGAGIGTKANTTAGVIEALQACDVCLYDALCPHELLECLPGTAKSVYVGKRKGEHSYKQDEICEILVDDARKGKKVVRLKGGDPGVFGRLTEETDILDEYELPYTVLPGISSLAAATTATGLLLTRRGVNRGFTVATPRKSGSDQLKWFKPEEREDFTQVFFMGASEVAAISKKLINEGHPADLPISIVYNAGTPERIIVSGCLNDIAAKLPDKTMPGIILAGKTANQGFLFSNHGILADQRIMFTGSRTLADKAERAISNFGGIPIITPMLKLEPRQNINIEKILDTDYLVVPSPSCAKILLDLSFDLRRLPKLAVCGSGTASVFQQAGIIPEVCAEDNYGVVGLVEALAEVLTGNEKITRLCSDKATSKLSNALKKITEEVVKIELYTNCLVKYDSMGKCDWVMFTSSSSVQGFVDNFSAKAMAGVQICAMGEPTYDKLKEFDITAIKPETATVEAMVFAIAAKQLEQQLRIIK